MESDEGAIFDYSDNPQEHLSFWMKDTSIALRILFINKNTSYNDFKKKIYFLVRKFLRNPIYDENNEEEFVNDKELSDYIEGISNYKLKQIISSFEKGDGFNELSVFEFELTHSTM